MILFPAQPRMPYERNIVTIVRPVNFSTAQECVHEIAKRLLALLCLSVRACFRPSVRREQLYSLWTNFNFSKICRKKFKFHCTVTIITGMLREDQYPFLIISRSFLLRMEICQTNVVEKIKKHVL